MADSTNESMAQTLEPREEGGQATGQVEGLSLSPPSPSPKVEEKQREETPPPPSSPQAGNEEEGFQQQQAQTEETPPPPPSSSQVEEEGSEQQQAQTEETPPPPPSPQAEEGFEQQQPSPQEEAVEENVPPPPHEEENVGQEAVGESPTTTVEGEEGVGEAQGTREEGEEQKETTEKNEEPGPLPQLGAQVTTSVHPLEPATHNEDELSEEMLMEELAAAAAETPPSPPRMLVRNTSSVTTSAGVTLRDLGDCTICNVSADNIMKKTLDKLHRPADTSLLTNLAICMENLPATETVQDCLDYLANRTGHTLADVMVAQYVLNGGVLMKQMDGDEEFTADISNTCAEE